MGELKIGSFALSTIVAHLQDFIISAWKWYYADVKFKCSVSSSGHWQTIDLLGGMKLSVLMLVKRTQLSFKCSIYSLEFFYYFYPIKKKWLYQQKNFQKWEFLISGHLFYLIQLSVFSLVLTDFFLKLNFVFMEVNFSFG